MSREYKLGDGNADILIEVLLFTRGIVSTDIARKLQGSAFVTIAKSTEPPNANGKGMITERTIGKAGMLADAELDIFSSIRLDLIPGSEWETLFKTLDMLVVIQGGADGPRNFKLMDEEKEKSGSGKTMTAHMRLKLNR
jgi:hypothetical protein